MKNFFKSLNVFSYWIYFFQELYIWYKFRNITIKNRELIYELSKKDYELRVDWLGRIYTVINLPEEMYNQYELLQRSYILSKLKPINDVLLKLGLSGSAYPYVEKLENSESYLIILTPDIEYIYTYDIVKNLFLTICYIIIIYYSYTRWIGPILQTII